MRDYEGEQGAEWPEVSFRPDPLLPEITVPAWRGGLGQEPDVLMHLAHMKLVFDECYRVLREDGVMFVNYGDCYAGSGGAGGDYNKGGLKEGQPKWGPRDGGIPHGNKMLVPHRVALMLQGSGWIVRNDVVWHKPNPMPESPNGWRWERERTKVAPQPKADEPYAKGQSKAGTRAPGPGGGVSNALKAKYEYGDELELRRGSWRHTNAHEFVFMASKQMQYWSNAERAREPNETDNPSLVGNRASDKFGALARGERHVGRGANGYLNPSGRNPRSVRKITTGGYSGKHFAVFPPDLVADFIKATVPRRCCPECGQGWAPVIDPNPEYEKLKGGPGFSRDGDWLSKGATAKEYRATDEPRGFIAGYRPTCNHPHDEADAVPGIVFDPFMGSGTTGAVAREHGVRWVGTDISREYLDRQAKVRTKSGTPSNALDGLPMFDKTATDEVA